MTECSVCGVCGVNAGEVCRGCVAGLEAEVSRLKGLIERDHTGLAVALDRVIRAAKGWDWIPDGQWGCYELERQTEEALREEIGRALGEIRRVAEAALQASGDRVTEAFRPECVAERLAAAREQLWEAKTDLAAAREVARSLADRVAAQSEVLSRMAER